jgi:hypothetical protein
MQLVALLVGVSDVAFGLAEHLKSLCADLFKIDTQAFEYASSDTFTLTYQPKQKMFSTNIMMIQATSFINGQLNHRLGTRSQTNLALDDAISPANNKFNGTPILVEFDTEIG